MLKRLIPTLLAVFAIVTINYAQRSPFRAGYVRIGISKLGNALDNSLSPLENLDKGNWSWKSGYVFERGKIYYFGLDNPGMVKVGIDWLQTGININFNNKSEWQSYATNRLGSPANVDKGLYGSLYMKLGPNLSINPVDGLIIDLRAQVMGGIAIAKTGYESGDNSESYENFDLPSGKVNVLIMPSFGATVRWKFIGVALDYMTGKPQYHYETETIDDAKAKMKTNILQAKLNLTF